MVANCSLECSVFLFSNVGGESRSVVWGAPDRVDSLDMRRVDTSGKKEIVKRRTVSFDRVLGSSTNWFVERMRGGK